VVCPQGDGWRDQIQSVGVIATGGSTFCTGFAVNNTAQDLTPYFMTANHCGIGSGNAASLVVYWNYQNSTCRTPGSPASGGPGDGSLSQFQTGSFFRAGGSTSDFTLVELDDDPDPDWNVVLAGWDRSTGDSASAVGIHHPNTDEKRISFENDATTTTSYLGTTSPGNGSHVRVIDWDLGTTEPGSSGSPLFNQDQRVVGQLHGGGAACGNNESDYYGRFSVSWDGGASASARLRDWLDPGNTGLTAIDHVSTAGMSVTPTAPVLHVGVLGGPFTNSSVVYTLANPTPTPVDYSVSLTASFGLLLNGGSSPVSGTLAGGGGSTMVTVSLGPDIDALAAGVYVETVVFSDLTNGIDRPVDHTVEVGQTLIGVTPAAGLESGGPVGGPFGGTIVYTVTSERPSPVTVEVSASQPWVSLNGGAGPIMLSLNGTGDFDTVTVGVAAAANALPAGLYNASVAFTNLAGGPGGTSRAVVLDVGRIVVPSTDTPLAIPDSGSISSSVVVTEDVCIGDVQVDIDITHTFVGDLIVELESPFGVIVRLHDRTGGSDDNIVARYDDDVTPPDGPGSLSDFDYASAAGTWTLRVIDAAAQDTGTLNSWTLRIAPYSGTCPTPVVVHSFPLDVNPGWSTQGQWAFGAPTGGGSGNHDPTSGFTGANVYGYNLAGDYPNNMGTTQYLTTTAMDCSTVVGARLRFQRWLGVESASFDHVNVQVSNNGTTWRRPCGITRPLRRSATRPGRRNRSTSRRWPTASRPSSCGGAWGRRTRR
jgi:subtilisin-like proprotein convertase family protein